MAPSSEVPGPRNTQILRLMFPISTPISSIGHRHCTVARRSEVPGPRNTSGSASYVLPINAISHWRSLFYTGLRFSFLCSQIWTFLPIWTLYPVFSSVGHRPLLAQPLPISRTLTSYSGHRSAVFHEPLLPEKPALGTRSLTSY